jgi:hypothetical protein
MPDGVIGVDVDHYGDKRGGDTLAALEIDWPEVPDRKPRPGWLTNTEEG